MSREQVIFDEDSLELEEESEETVETSESYEEETEVRADTEVRYATVSVDAPIPAVEIDTTMYAGGTLRAVYNTNTYNWTFIPPQATTAQAVLRQPFPDHELGQTAVVGVDTSIGYLDGVVTARAPQNTHEAIEPRIRQVTDRIEEAMERQASTLRAEEDNRILVQLTGSYAQSDDDGNDEVYRRTDEDTNGDDNEVNCDDNEEEIEDDGDPWDDDVRPNEPDPCAECHFPECDFDGETCSFVRSRQEQGENTMNPELMPETPATIPTYSLGSLRAGDVFEIPSTGRDTLCAMHQNRSANPVPANTVRGLKMVVIGPARCGVTGFVECVVLTRENAVMKINLHVGTTIILVNGISWV